MEVPQLTRRKPKELPPLIVEPEDEDDAFSAVPVEQMSARGVFLLAMAVTSFAAFTLFALAELTHHHLSFLLAGVLQGDTHAAAQWALLLAVPATSAAAWFPISISHAPTGMLRITSALARRYRRNHMFAIYQSVGWTLYDLFVALQAICFSSDKVRDLPFCRPGSRSVQAVAAFIAEVLIISSVLTLEKRRDRNRQRRKDRFVVQLNNFNNMLLLVGATLLALASEYTRVFPHPSGSSMGYPMATGLGSLALFVTALFNTYGLGGVLSTKDGWNFYQPFVGGARFVLFQIVSWTCFGAGAALQVLYLLSLVVVELELFVGAMAVAGSLFVVAEIGMMMSLLVFRKAGQSPKRSATSPRLLSFHERMRDFADESLGVLVVGGLANIQFIPNALLFIFFAATTNLSPAGVAFYGVMATGMEFVVVVSRSIATHLYLKDSHNGLLKEVNRYHVKYVLPQIVTACLPAVATYRHYIYDMEAFVPVLLLTIFIYIYELTYRGNPQQTGCRERASWVTGRSFLVDTVKRYFSGTIIRMAPLDPEKQYVLSFHPHGIMPISVMWLQFTAQWRKLFPNFYAHILTASILHQIPLARDVLHFYGSREVTRSAFAYTLQQKESVLLVPGGQAEMLQQQSAKNEVRVYTHHKGFIRLAIEHGVPLVPVLSFKEGEMMDNVQAPMLQRWFVKKLAFPFPYFPYGRGMLPIPRKVDIPIVVGEPLEVPHIEHPTQANIDEVHARYFAVLQDMFDRYKDEVGCGDYKLVLI
ncbi:diacylglycerol O-acyltransferase, putative [Phytophthora infestans T30-4]|uniref:Diacylglycerol O-acyltransferase, putative n=1 Tax=Phytophthora infestans (strain T30-4) TaxID=403677 RepID=D0MYM8_PHYIT|nr:diacylglycerol O-acyltransferase, putative [Phytophthora infestans T30-4]EEY66276.1 diacylglycerol O-acyltransferase, putative [Phytophthora infestans T30-4]|eukprot:XP_002906875.1 diacylglycerol O-acyltransferase, putative [Phytophthora infestans T30-4]